MMTPSDISDSTEPELVPSTATIYARVPSHLKAELDAWTQAQGMTLSTAVQRLLEDAVSERMVAPGRDPWVDRAHLIEALQQIQNFQPSGYPALNRAIIGALHRAGGSKLTDDERQELEHLRAIVGNIEEM